MRLVARVERLEGIRPVETACGTCGGAGPMALVGVPEGTPLPGWLDEDGRCRACQRPARVYRGIDLACV